MIIFRYLSRELLTSFLLIITLLLAILLSNQLIKYLNQIAGGQLAFSNLWMVIVLEIPRLLTILFPASLFLAILLTYSRLHIDYEMTALSSCGLSQTTLTLLTLPVVALVMLNVSCLSLWINPKLLLYRQAFIAKTASTIALKSIQSGRFQPFSGGRRVIYVERISPDHKWLSKLFMAQRSDNTATPLGQQAWTIFTAQHAYQTINPSTKAPFLIMLKGQRYQRLPGKNEYYIAQFSRYSLRIDSPITRTTHQKEILSTLALLHADSHHNPALASELQWRLSAPLSALLLALLAIPLSRVNPRQSRYQSILLAILIYILYLNLLLIGRKWIESAYIPYTLGLWWIHGLLLLVVIAVWLYTLGWHTLKSMVTHPQTSCIR